MLIKIIENKEIGGYTREECIQMGYTDEEDIKFLMSGKVKIGDVKNIEESIKKINVDKIPNWCRDVFKEYAINDKSIEFEYGEIV